MAIAESNQEVAAYEELIQASRLLINFLDNGLSREQVFTNGNSCSTIDQDNATVERARCEERVIRETEANYASTVVAQLPTQDCRSHIMVTASAVASTRSLYNRRDGSAASRSVQRARALYREIINHCPPTLGFENVLPYINGEDLFTQAEIVEGVQCANRPLLRLGHWFRHRQDQSLIEYSRAQRHTFYDQETQERLFNQRNQRMARIRSAIESKCNLAMERNPELDESYRVGFSATEL